MKLLLSTAHNDKSGSCAPGSLGKSTSTKAPLSLLMHSGKAAGREGPGSGRAAWFQTCSRATVLSLFANLSPPILEPNPGSWAERQETEN